MRIPNFILLTLIALAAGIGAGIWAVRLPLARDLAGRFSGRGKLTALVNGTGFYAADADAELAYDSARGAQLPDRASVVHRLVAEENLRALSAEQRLVATEVQRQFDLLYFQFADQSRWTDALDKSGLSENTLRGKLRYALAARKFLEKRTAGDLRADEAASERYFAAHQDEFAQPQRIQASHLFVAAPGGWPDELIEEKRLLIQSLADRLTKGEDFSQLVAEASEDEATKSKGGDLGWFSFWRMPPDFFQPISKLRVGQTSPPFQTGLGFHIARVTNARPARQMSLAEARPQIQDRLLDEQRMTAVAALESRLGRQAVYFRP